MTEQPANSSAVDHSDEKPKPPELEASEFQKLSEEDDLGLIAEFWLFLKEEKRWWLTPIIVACLAITGLAWFTSTGVYPFIYSLF